MHLDELRRARPPKGALPGDMWGPRVPNGPQGGAPQARESHPRKTPKLAPSIHQNCGAACTTARGGLPTPVAARPRPAPQISRGGPRPTAMMSPVCPYKEPDYAALVASGARRICPHRNFQERPVAKDNTVGHQGRLFSWAPPRTRPRASPRPPFTDGRQWRTPPLSCW